MDLGVSQGIGMAEMDDESIPLPRSPNESDVLRESSPVTSSMSPIRTDTHHRGHDESHHDGIFVRASEVWN